MKISSFDIFDTCLVRKCGTPENFFDVFSLRAFNHEPPEWARQEFVAARRLTESKLWDENPHYTLQDIWAEMDWTHQFLKTKAELCRMEQELEQEMLVSVLKMRDMVNECRKRGDKIIFISDMYLSSAFLIDVMRGHGFYQDGDSLYVSCECRAAKWNGDLFRYVRDKEGLKSFRHWHHYGDNKVGDYKAPKKLGIRCTLINHEYTPYQKQWKDNDYSLGFKYPSILAGLGRALRYSTEWTTHTDFVLDIIAPFYCSWMYQVLQDAQEKGIKRLYFCARDAYQIHKIALQMQPLFPEVGIEYVYMSRKALYNEANDEAKIAYFKQIGLATKTDKVAIVDTTTCGKTVMYINEYLRTKGYHEIIGYYYLLWNIVDVVDHAKFNVLVYDSYLNQNSRMNGFLSLNHLFIFENLFGLSSDLKTIDYEFKDETAKPVYAHEILEEDCKYMDDKDWVAEHQNILCLYARMYCDLGLGIFSKDIFERIAHASVVSFFDAPPKVYLQALANYYFYGEGKDALYPCIKKIFNPLELRNKNRKYYWRRGCIYWTLPDWLLGLLEK